MAERTKNLLFSRANERKTKTHTHAEKERERTQSSKVKNAKTLTIIQQHKRNKFKIEKKMRIKKNGIEIKLLIQHKNKDLLHQYHSCSICQAVF